jgi:hypothetical protein
MARQDKFETEVNRCTSRSQGPLDGESHVLEAALGDGESRLAVSIIPQADQFTFTWDCINNTVASVEDGGPDVKVMMFDFIKKTHLDEKTPHSIDSLEDIGTFDEFTDYLHGRLRLDFTIKFVLQSLAWHGFAMDGLGTSSSIYYTSPDEGDCSGAIFSNWILQDFSFNPDLVCYKTRTCCVRYDTCSINFRMYKRSEQLQVKDVLVTDRNSYELPESHVVIERIPFDCVRGRIHTECLQCLVLYAANGV